MPSSIAWMDTSARELRQAREIIRLFEDKDSRDELGIGTIRDALSNLLFPGTSVLQTRARYYLFVPWIYQIAADKGLTGQDFDRYTDRLERDLIDQLKKESAGTGIIGSVAGRQVQTLPSSTYWNGLHTYGIINVRRAHEIPVSSTVEDMMTELADRTRPAMAQLPPAPEMFPHATVGGFTLTGDEARWLCEHIVTNHPASPLAQLLTPETLDAQLVDALTNCVSPWLHTDIREDPRVEQARRFSRVMNGASILYNLLLAEACAPAGFSEKAGIAQDHRVRLQEWQGQIGKDVRIMSWETEELWSLIAPTATIPFRTRQFVDAWMDRLQSTVRADRSVADDAELRDLVAQRERRKGAQSRLANPRMLATWSGEAGIGALNYRWANVRVIVADILEGLMR